MSLPSDAVTAGRRRNMTAIKSKNTKPELLVLTGRSFVFFDAPQSGHLSIVDMQTATDPAGAEPSAASLRGNLLKKVLETSPDVPTLRLRLVVPNAKLTT